MAKVVLPDVNDLDDVIADYLDTMFPEMEFSEKRESVIEECREPFAELVAAWKNLGNRHTIEGRIWRTFMRDLCQMSEAPGTVAPAPRPLPSRALDLAESYHHSHAQSIHATFNE